MSLDEQLLAQKREADETAGRAGDLRQAQRAGSDGSKSAGSGAYQENESAPASLREAVKEEKKKEAAKSGAEGTADKVAAAAVAPIKKSTSTWLRQAWFNIIPSWGATFIWVVIHAFFLNPLFGEKFFCKMGDEWKGMIPAAEAAAGAKLPVKESNEIWLVRGCCFGCLLVFIAIACFFIIIGTAISDPVAAARLLGTVLWDLLKVILKGVIPD